MVKKNLQAKVHQVLLRTLLHKRAREGSSQLDQVSRFNFGNINILAIPTTDKCI